MGCTTSTEGALDMNQMYKEMNLREPWSDEYECNFEKELFYAINVFRSKPELLMGPVKDIVKLIPEKYGKDKDLVK